MFKRKILKEFENWKISGGKKKSLVVKGMRQIGKTSSVLEFARANYENVVYINFKENENAKRVFDSDLNVGRITIDLSALFPNVHFVENKTVIIFDEIQECANARASIKPFMEDGRYDVICTGSLLGIKGYNRKKGKGVPTGFERIIYMKPMDFEEFLWAKGIDEKVISYLKECFAKKEPVSEATHNAMLRYFKEYLCVGGLPYVVSRFVETNDMNVVWQEQQDILEEYKDDFGKHLDENENEEIDRTLLGRINRVFDSIPAQLAKENNKFVYSQLEKKGRSENYQTAIQWLYDCGIINICHNLTNIAEPLEGYKIENTFKIYVQDSGLFVAMLERGTAAKILSGDLGFYKGAIYENIIADCFSKQGRKLFYFRKESGLEIDFVENVGGELAIIEVKATTGRSKSAKTVLSNDNYDAKVCYKLSKNNIGVAGKMVTLPYYMAMFLE
ncbi:ATP-binding protein [Fibrobacter sp. UBA2449]|uniref:ATP-binding protein n=1 Tax=Fibrobacter sp. UBA2449 TaxID=1946529 RepID=UPI0025BBD82C|nr:AAA family ATPase [Fibrobacter sp. UBA2449]